MPLWTCMIWVLPPPSRTTDEPNTFVSMVRFLETDIVDEIA